MTGRRESEKQITGALSERAVDNVVSSLNLLRGPIAQCCPLSEDEIDHLSLAVKVWFRVMG